MGRWRASRWAALLAGAIAAGAAGCGTCNVSDGCASDCGDGVEQRPLQPALHVPVGTTVMYTDNPPTSGSHYPIWAGWSVYNTPVQPELFVHNLEHGGIVLLYNCPSGCDPDVQKLIDLRLSLPPDQYHEVRVILAPEPALPHKFAALAWGWRWQGEALSESTIRCLITARYDRGPESIP